MNKDNKYCHLYWIKGMIGVISCALFSSCELFLSSIGEVVGGQTGQEVGSFIGKGLDENWGSSSNSQTVNHKSTLENISLGSGKGTWNSGILLQDAIKEWHKRYSENDSLSQGLIGNVSTDENGSQPKRMVTKRFATKTKGELYNMVAGASA